MNSLRYSVWAAGGLALAVATWCEHAHASPQDIYGYGTRTPAMGSTGTAGGEGVDVVWANPALLSIHKERELTLGYQVARYDLHARGNGLPGDMHPEPFRATVIGAVLPVPFGGVLKERIAVGFGFLAPTDVLVRGRVLYPEVPQFSIVGDRMQTVGIHAGFGAHIWKGLRVGAGFSVLAAVAGTVVVATDNSGSVGTKVDDQLVSSYAPTIGASYDITEKYRVGVAYRGVLEARFAVRIDVYDLGGITVPPFNIAGLAQYDPQQIQFEAARVAGPLKVALGGTYKFWGDYPGAPEPTVLCPPEKPDCKALKTDSANFKNTITLRLGAEYDLAKGRGWVTKLRGGYFYEPTPVPKQRGYSNYFDNDRHVVSLGYGLDLAKPLPPIRLDLFTQLQFLASRTHEKLAEIPATHPGYPKAETGGLITIAGLAATVRF